MTLDIISEAIQSGARLAKACATLGLSCRTVQRWQKDKSEDARCGPKTSPPNKLSDAEVKEVLTIANSPEFRDLSPKQIVPALADGGKYVASESTFYRILKAEDLQHHRGRALAPVRRTPPAPCVATGPNQVWSWDITYMKSSLRGSFFYLYLIVDVWSRKVVGFEIHDVECNELASKLITKTCKEMGVKRSKLTLHSDNGGPMKGSTMLATLEMLGIVPSFSRPSVSNDNPYSESLFRTLKYRPEYPSKPFEDIDAARVWVTGFVAWYNTEHLHSGIRFVTPDDRHFGREADILDKRKKVYERARKRNPKRWTGKIRNWDAIETVYLNPEKVDVEIETTSEQQNSIQEIAPSHEGAINEQPLKVAA